MSLPLGAAVLARSDELIRRELAVRLTHSHDAILRRVPDLYRKIIGEALLHEANTDLGKAAQLRAAQRALDRIANLGVVDFVDTSGRRWTMQSYVEMAVRTGALRARTDAQLDVYLERGIALVYVPDHAGTCPICARWESTLLTVDAMGDAFEVEGHKVEHSVREAIEAGLLHPNCRHELKPWRPGTVIPPPDYRPDEFLDQQEQRRIERTVRAWKRREAAAFTPEAKAQAEAKVAEWSGKAKAHADTSTARRLRGRERIDQALNSPTPRRVRTAEPLHDVQREPRPIPAAQAHVPYVPTGDLSAVHTFTDQELDAELAAATARMSGSRHNKSGLAYHDAKLAVNVLSGEKRIRAKAELDRHFTAIPAAQIPR